MISAAAIVLAAGASTRLGRPKQLVDWEGRPLLEEVVARVARWPVSPVVVVLGSDADAVLEAVRFADDVVVAVNEEWEEGMASSLRVGLDILSRGRGPEWAFIVLGDQPHLPGEVPGRLLEAAEFGARPAVLPVYRYQRGNPALVARSLWPRLMSLEGDRGAAGLFAAHPEWVDEVRIDAAMPRDVDTEMDVADLLHSHRRADSPDETGR